MSKILDRVLVSARGSVNLFIALTLSTPITSLGTIVVMRLLC
ncbi:MAG: hypothetical protein ACE5GD_10965 [Candidatus Geothermarchaeales archaeon]